MRWYSTCHFEVAVHQILIELSLVFKDVSDMTWFTDIFSVLFH